MNIMDRIKGTFLRGLGISDEKAWSPLLWNLAGYQSLSGENVNEYTSLTYSAFYNAITLIAGTIGSLPLHLMQRKGESKRVADDRKLYRVMHDQWNPYMTAMDGRETMMAHILTWGNGFAEKITNGTGEVIELWPITPNRVRIEVDGQNKIYYRIRVENQEYIFDRERILHIPGLGFDGFIGYSIIAMARKSLGLSMALESFGSLYFGQGTHPGVIVSHPGKLSQPAHDNLQKSMVTSYSGLGSSHRLMLLEEGMKLEKLGIPPNDSQFLESRQFQIPEVARWFNLPPHKLKDLTKSSFSNIEQEQISFVTDSILPWLVRLEQNYNMQLLTPFDKALSGNGRLYFKHVVEGLLRGDAASRGKYYQVMFGIGALSVNEIRAYEDLDPIENGDIHLVPLNMTTLENAGKIQPEPKETPKKVDEEEDEEADNEAMVQDREQDR